jgi:hypothetical protein
MAESINEIVILPVTEQNREQNTVEDVHTHIGKECVICVEKMNRSTLKPVKCEYCDFIACVKCCGTFILNEIDPKCMNITQCNRIWTRQFIVKNFTKKFINRNLKTHREQVLFDIERNLLPTTQVVVERIVKIEKIDRYIREKLDEIHQIKSNIFEKQREKVAILRESNNCDAKNQRATFIRPCSDTNCRGFLSSQWKCGLCEKWTCSECLATKENGRNAEHECDPDCVATAKMILKETKSCPTCGIGIFKIDGCSQMFCTQCNTTFDWVTGRIYTSNIHNPHYFEWLRRTGGNQPNNDNPDGGRCNVNEFNDNIYRRIYNVVNRINPPLEGTVPFLTKLNKIVQRMTHLNYVEIQHYNTYLTNPNEYNQDLRVKYLQKEIDENEFKTLLQRKEKRRKKNQEVVYILQTVYNGTVDIIFRLERQVRTLRKDEPNLVFPILNEVDELIDYANDCFADVGKTYESCPLVFSVGRTLNLR